MAKVNVYIPDELLEQVDAGDVKLAVSDLFVYEVLRTVRRKTDGVAACEVLRFFERAGLITVPPVVPVLRETLQQASALGCDVYDACAPAIASLLGASLYSADRRAHATFPGVTLIG